MILHALVLAVNAVVMAVCIIGAAWMLRPALQRPSKEGGE